MGGKAPTVFGQSLAGGLCVFVCVCVCLCVGVCLCVELCGVCTYSSARVAVWIKGGPHSLRIQV